MASPCSQLTTYTNILDLPQVVGIDNGNFLIVETPDGTSILDFQDFIIPLDNTTFGGTITALQVSVNSLYATVCAISSVTVDTLSANLGEIVDNISINLNGAGTKIQIKDNGVNSNKLSANSVITTKIADSTSSQTGVTFSKLQYISGASVIGKSSSTAGVAENITGAANQVLRVNSNGVLSFGTISAAFIEGGNGTFPIQVVQAVKTDTSAIASGGSWEDIPSMSRTITRVKTNSKVRIQAAIQFSTNNSNHALAFRIQRNSGDLSSALGATAGSRIRATASGNSSGGPSYNCDSVVIDFIDDLTGITDAAVEYKIQAALYTGSGYINRGYADNDAAYSRRTISTLTLTELA